MPMINDQEYLRHRQYGTPDRLVARAELHRRFSTNQRSWTGWVLEALELRPGLKVLEVGGGPGWLWRESRERLDEGLHVAVTDFSPGMVREARSALAQDPRFAFAVVDTMAIPFADASFDLAVANHMLYHVPDLPAAVHELGRVLRPGGRLVAATNGVPHMRELHELLHQVVPSYPAVENRHGAFRLENAAQVLAPIGPVEVRRFEDSLWITEAEPLVDYAASLWDVDALPERAALEELRAIVHDRIRKEGGLHITKDSGLAVATKRTEDAAGSE